MNRIRRLPRPFDFQLVQIQQSAQNNKVPATLQSVEYKCQIINNILKTTLVQTFRSQSNNEYSETQYMFPIQENVCLESFQAKYNDKTIKGIVKAKEDAKKEYQSNKAQGNFVTYAETTKNKIDEYVKIMIGNLPPSVEVEIVLSFSQQLESILNKYYVAYIPMQYVEDEISAKLGKNILTLDLFCTGKITYATSKGYPAEKTIVDDNTAKFGLSQAFLQKNVDFQLIFSYEGMFDPQVILGSSQVYHEDSVKKNLLPVSHSAMISFIPNFNKELTQEIDDTIRAAIMNGDDILSDEFQQKLNQEMIDHLDSSRSEFIFLLDRSGSMSGKPIQKAVEALALFLKSLPNDSYFNVVSFGSGFQKLFPQSMQYNSKNMNDAISIISKYTADLGGTEIYQPLQNIFNNQQRIKGYNRQIYLLTDGAVNQPENVVNLIKKNNKFNRVHSIGFGSGADKFLIEQSSVAGKGIHKIIELSSDLSEVIISMLSSSITPTFDDFTLSYDKSIFDSTHPTSTDFPCVFKDEIINIHLFFKPLVDIQALNDAQKVIQIEYYDSQKKEKVKKDIRLEMSDCFTCNADLQESVFKLGKQLYLNENMEQNKGGEDLTQQATDFQLMTEKTALICVIEQLNDEQKIMFQNTNNNNIYTNQIQQPIVVQQQNGFGTQFQFSNVGIFGQLKQSFNNQGGCIPGMNVQSGLFGSIQQQQQHQQNNQVVGKPQQQMQNQSGGLFGNQAQQNNSCALFGQQPIQQNCLQKPTGGGLFGSQPQQQNYLSPQQPQQQIQNISGGLFGGQASIQSQSGSLFGNQSFQNNSCGLFGQQLQSQNNLSSSQPQQQMQNQTGGLFGNQPPQNNSGGLFQTQLSQQNNFGGGLFSSQPQQQMQNQSGGLFGNQALQNSPCGLFGSQSQQQNNLSSSQPQQQMQNQTGGLFGNQPPQNNSGGLFQAQLSQQNQYNNFGGGLFSSQPQQQMQNQSGGLFGNQALQNSPCGLFGSQSQQQNNLSSPQLQEQVIRQTGGLFGNQIPQNNSSSIFGSQPQQQNCLFSQQPQQQMQNQQVSLFRVAPSQQNTGLQWNQLDGCIISQGTQLNQNNSKMFCQNSPCQQEQNQNNNSRQCNQQIYQNNENKIDSDNRFEIEEEGKSENTIIKVSNLNIENILSLVDSEGIWSYDETIIKQSKNLTQQNIHDLSLYFNHKDAFMTMIMLCILDLFYDSYKSKWFLISKKSTAYVKKNLNQYVNFNDIKQKIIEILKN